MVDQVKQINTRTRKISVSAMVKKAWGSEYSRRDVVYEFSNGRRFESTDRGESGVYRKKRWESQ